MNTRKRKTKQPRIRTAFWSYDLYPYILSGRIVGGPQKWCGETRYEIEGFGKGTLFRPLFVLSGKPGVELS